jgi:hypothetical protein
VPLSPELWRLCVGGRWASHHWGESKALCVGWYEHIRNTGRDIDIGQLGIMVSVIDDEEVAAVKTRPARLR